MCLISVPQLINTSTEHNVPVLVAVIGGIKAVLRARGFDVGHARGEAETPLPAEAVKALTDFIAAADWAVE